MMADILENKANRNTSDAIFIMGIEMRSGTNYLWQMMRLHPQCHVGSVGEDFLLEYSDLIQRYADKLYLKWTPEWRERMGNSTSLLLEKIGDCLIDFIKRPYYLYPGETKSDSQERLDFDFPDKVLLTKTPSIKNIDLFFSLFPYSRLIILVRDGRSVVESGMRSFAWDFEDAVRRWDKAAKEVIQFMENNPEKSKRCKLVRYEDLVKTPIEALKEIFAFLGLSHEEFNFDAATNLHVFGSSDIKLGGQKIHWKKTEKDKNFSPINRWEKWENVKHIRFNWLAGESQRKLGYSINDSGGRKIFYIINNQLLDWKWKYRHILKGMIKRQIRTRQ